jgi:hypothetical protein
MTFSLLKKLTNYIKRIKKAIIRANRPTASVNANPRIANRNNSPFKLGFRATELINDPNTIPTPAPAPTSPTVAIPAPNNLQHSNRTSILSNVKK